MNTPAARIEDLPHVDASLNYLLPMAERPRNYTFDPPAGIPRSNSAHESRTVPIHDARAQLWSDALVTSGLQIARPDSEMDSL